MDRSASVFLRCLLALCATPKAGFALAVCACACACAAFGYSSYLLEPRSELMRKLDERFGPASAARLVDLARALGGIARQDEMARVQAVNQIGNRARYVSDSNLWRNEDYWATPAEFSALNAGDCEDFALIKYFALREMGVPAEKLRMTYVRLVRDGRIENHMVLAYYAEAGAEPFVLDNLDKRFLPAHERTDLTPVYSFNDDRLWKMGSGSDREMGSSQQLRKWKELLERVKGELQS